MPLWHTVVAMVKVDYAAAANAMAKLEQVADRRRALEREQAALRADLAEAVKAARVAGVGATEIARVLGVARATIYNALEESDPGPAS